MNPDKIAKVLYDRRELQYAAEQTGQAIYKLQKENQLIMIKWKTVENQLTELRQEHQRQLIEKEEIYNDAK